MQNSVPVAARSWLFFLSACFTATVVLSERIALAPIDALTDFVSSNRNAQEMSDDFMGGMLDFDDDTLIALLTDEDYIKCAGDTQDLENSFFELAQAKADFESIPEGSSMGNPEDSSMGNFKIKYPKEARETYRQVCADSGGYFEYSGGSISCNSDIWSFSIDGWATCYADTEECKAIDFLDITATVTGMLGYDCDVIDPSDTSAGAGHHWSFNYLALSGMVVGASFF